MPTVRIPSFRARLRHLCRSFLALLVLFMGSCADSTGPDPLDPDRLLRRLNAIPGVEAREIAPYYGYPRAFQLDIRQPVDHRNRHGPRFTQRAYLSHISDTLPMVFAPSGYGTSPRSGQELAGILSANCLSVTHRYFPDARPTETDWEHLTIWQSAADHHRIVTLLREVYTGQWISTGASKGGETVLFHRRFHPQDVEATVAYVAPLLFSPEDPRFMPYLRSRGTADDRRAIRDFQRRLLERKEELLPEFEDWFRRNGYTFSLSPAPSFESAVLAYEWGFWQRHIFDRWDIPAESAPGGEMVNHLAEVVRLHFSSDVFRDYFKAYVYQALTEIGAPFEDFTELADLISETPVDVYRKYGFPADLEFVYRPASIPDVLDWLQREGHRIIYIYGEVDPWTGGAVQLTGQADALKIVQSGQDHQVRIGDLDLRDLVLETLGEWLGRDLLAPSAASPLRVPSRAGLLGTPEDPTLYPGRR